MLVKNISKSCLVVCMFLYATTVDASGLAQKITDTSALYAITFSFTTENYELGVPVIATRTGDERAYETISYELTTSLEGDTSTGVTTSLVLSDAPLVDGMYRVPENTEASFTVLTILSLNPESPRAKYGVALEELPFTVYRGDTVATETLPNLGAFATSEIGLK